MKELDLNEIKEYLELLKESINAHDQECATCRDELDAHTCEYLLTMRTEVRRIDYKLNNAL